ncbi:MAG: hypothetical protein JW915_16595 [Chitinispirillaceae bacterium]|nr:hypothetical protein [Chitinispirillaceae bacterium]
MVSELELIQAAQEGDREILEVFVEHCAAGETITPAEVGNQFGVCRERIRQLKERAIQSPAFRKLRKDLRAVLKLNINNKTLHC